MCQRVICITRGTVQKISNDDAIIRNQVMSLLAASLGVDVLGVFTAIESTRRTDANVRVAGTSSRPRGSDTADDKPCLSGSGSATALEPKSFHDSKARSRPVSRSRAKIRCLVVASRSQAEFVEWCTVCTPTRRAVVTVIGSVGSQSILSGSQPLFIGSTLSIFGRGCSSGEGDSCIAGVVRGSKMS